MSFISLSFLVLVVIVVAVYYFLPQKFRWVLLLFASCVFYAYFNFYLIFLLASTVVTSYLAGLIIGKAQKKTLKRVVMIVAVVSLLAILLYFKYAGFLVNNAVSLINLFGASLDPIVINVILPVGISFYTFQTLAYVIDVYRGKIEPERHFGYFALFVSYFPQLVAGPIEKAQNLLPQFRAEHKFDGGSFKEGLALMAAGFLKKVVVADMFAVVVNAVYNSTDIPSLTGLSVLLTTVLFFVQIYCDFSGYSDIAIGCSKLLGIELMTNFNKPFRSQSITEFWTRWHISLTEWFNQYVYMPLTFKSIGKKHLALRSCLNVLIVMFLCGLWHGASWNYVIWGVWLGLYQCVETLTRRSIDGFYKKRNINKNGRFLSALRMVRTYVLLLLPLLFFRANTFADALALTKVMFTGWGFGSGYFGQFVAETGLTAFLAIAIVASLVILKFTDDNISVTRGKNILAGKNSAWIVQFIFIVWLVVAVWCFIYEKGQVTPFIYFQF